VRFINLFLVGYFVLVLGIGIGFWPTGVFSRLAPVWIGEGALVAIGGGIMLAVSSGKPPITEKTQP
jgi:hypothetical protein